MHRIIQGDCVVELANLPSKSVDVVVTSPPYNLDIDYDQYRDCLPIDAYLRWSGEWIAGVDRVLKPNGSFFLNVSGSLAEPWTPFDVAAEARRYFQLQNRIIWVKSVAIEERTYGHFKPINSKRFLNDTHEFIFHFTSGGSVPIDRIAVGVPYTHKSNLTRWKHRRDRRCAGNCWFIPYETVQAKGEHPAIFPVDLPTRCIKMHGVTPDMVVLDPFGGTGTTAVACERLGIDSVMIEIDPKYVDMATRRILHEDGAECEVVGREERVECPEHPGVDGDLAFQGREGV